MAKEYAVTVANHTARTVFVVKVEASSELEAAILAIKDEEGFEEWDWNTFKSYKSLARELSECDFSVATKIL